MNEHCSKFYSVASKNMSEQRKLRGHDAAATCCIASLRRPGLVATAAEDGRVCWHDLRCKDVLFSMDVGNGNPVSSLCFKPANEDIFYVSSENGVKCFDLNMASSVSQTTEWKQIESYYYNKDEINQIACHSKSPFLAAADDTGDIKIIDLQQRCLYKTLRAGHKSVPFSASIICSSVQFLPWRSWEVITGGLDSKLVMWDFSKGRPNKIMDFGNEADAGQCCNPAFVHALAVPDLETIDRIGKICAVARGDGVINIIDIESELSSSLKSKAPSKQKKGSAKPSLEGEEESSSNRKSDENQNDKKLLCLDYSVGGHVSAVSSVTFSAFGEKGKFIISGSNDKSVKVWNWSKPPGISGEGVSLLLSDISLRRKVNMLCTTPSDSENLIVCDTSKLVKVYTVS